jgi:hypothetical protein
VEKFPLKKGGLRGLFFVGLGGYEPNKKKI